MYAGAIVTINKNIYFQIFVIFSSMLVLSYFIAYFSTEVKRQNNLNIIQPVYYNYIVAIEEYMKNSENSRIYNYENSILIHKNNNIFIYIIRELTQEILYQENYTNLSFNYNKLLEDHYQLINNPSIYSTIQYKQNENHFLVFFKKISTSTDSYLVIIGKDYNSIFKQEKKFFLILFSSSFLILLIVNFYILSIFRRKKLQEKLNNQINKEYNLFFDLITSNPQSLMMLIDNNGLILKITETFEDFILYKKNEIYNKHLSKIMPDFKMINQSFAIQNKKDSEINIVCKNNSTKSVIMTTIPYFGVNEKIERFLLLFNDLTEIKQKNDQLAKELITTRTFSKITQLITNTSDPKLIVKTIVEETKGLIDYDHGTLFLLNANELNAYYSNNPELNGQIKNIKLQIGEGLTGLVAKTQKGMIVNNALNSPIPSIIPNTDDKEECLISIPLINKTKLIGVATFSRIGNKSFKDEDLKVLELLAAQAASVLDSSMLLNQLALSERKYYSLINQSALSILILKERMISFCNKRFVDLINVPEKEIINNDILNFIVHKEKAVFASHLTSFLLENHCDDFNINLVSKDNKKLVMSFSLSMILWENQQSIMVTALDITEKVELNNQLLQTQKLESVGALASGIAHDFKNILASITGAADMILMKENKDNPIFNFANIIKVSADRGTKLSQRLLGFTRKDEYEQQVFNLNDILKEIIEIASYTFEKNIEIQTLLSSESTSFEGDPVKIQQCILNLCVNARDAMPHGGILKIESSVKNYDEIDFGIQDKLSKNRYNCIVVTDSGCGINNELKQKIFEPFFTTKEKGKGTGLGLSTTKSIIDEYNGFIFVDSENGKGTTFTIILPFTEFQYNNNSMINAKMDIKSHEILIVDDEEFVLEVAKELLQELGNIVHIADSGHNAIKLYKENQNISLAIIDRMMPKMDGIQLFNELKALNPELKIVIASGFKDDKEYQMLKNSGLFDYITKPYRLDDLNRILSS